MNHPRRPTSGTRINWTQRAVFLLALLFATTTVTLAAVDRQYPNQPVTDQGVHVVRWAPSPTNDDQQATDVWCQSITTPTRSNALADHLETLRHSDRYRNTCGDHQ